MNESLELIFVVGNSRSGTTMMSRILGKHSVIYSFKELQFFEHLISLEQICSKEKIPMDKARSLFSELVFANRDGVFAKGNRNKYFNEASELISTGDLTAVEVFRLFCSSESKKNSRRVACEQTPKNLHYVSEILCAIPNARIINMIRDPRDVILSQKLRWKRRFLGASSVPWFRETIRSWLNYHPITMANMWKSAVKVADKLEMDSRFINVHFEKLLTNPEREIRKICDFLGIDFDVNMLLVPRVGSSTEADNSGAIGIDGSKQGKWKNGGLTQEELSICQYIAGCEMQQHGYELTDTRMSSMLWTWNWSTFVCKMSLALLFNLNRTKNLRASIQRRFFS